MATNVTPLEVSVSVALAIVDRDAALAHARGALVAAGEAAPGEDASDLLREGDDVALLATVANPWRLVDGAEATGILVSGAGVGHVATVTFAVLDGELVAPSVAAWLAARGRADARVGRGNGPALAALVEASLDAPGIEVLGSLSGLALAGGDGDDAVLAEAEGQGHHDVAEAA